MNRSTLFGVVALCLLLPSLSRGQWQPAGTPISSPINDQNFPAVMADGTGGVFVVWQDSRASNWDIYIQRVDGSGRNLWMTNGVPLCTFAGFQRYPALVSDGAGGAIVAWQDRRSGTYDVYAQRINAAGVVQWDPDGVAVNTVGEPWDVVRIIADGAGGAIIAWDDYRTGIPDIYAQRINSIGAVQWVGGGVALCTDVWDQYGTQIVTDGAGGAIVTWHDFRTFVFDIFAQRVNFEGTVKWLNDGVAVCADAADQVYPAIATDGNGGAIITWDDRRFGASDVFAQRVDGSGVAQWTPNGVVICNAPNYQNTPVIQSDGVGGAFIAWRDDRSGSGDIYAQRIDGMGAIQWYYEGVTLCTAISGQTNPRIVTDGSGGAIVAWNDLRTGWTDTYAQRVNGVGVPQWTPDGVAVGDSPANQLNPAIAWDEAGGAVVAWGDTRANIFYDLYAQRIETMYGYWGRPEPTVKSVADIPNDQGGVVALNWEASGRDLPSPATIDFYSVWRAVDLAAMESTAGDAVTPIHEITSDAAPGVRTSVAGSPYFWELVGTQTAYRWPNYSFAAQTRADSVAASAGNEFFMVAAHDVSDEHIAFMSNVMSGHSVDNLAPTAPLLLTAQRAGADVELRWNRVRVPDLRDYAVYRATSSGVTPVVMNFLSSADDTVLVDAGAPTNALYYIVTAFDVHHNQSAPSNEASVGATTNVGDTPSITQLTVLQNRPNPFQSTTEFEIGLPEASEVEIEVYDVAGRRVRVQSWTRQAAGWQRVAFDGRDDAGRPLVSGVYFCRVTAGTTVTRKMVIAR